MKNYLVRQKDILSEAEEKSLENLNIMIAGAGGLGTNQAVQFQRLGVNKIYLYDYDKVELSNLNRQICYGRNDVGRYKVDAAADFLNYFGLDTKIIPCRKKIKKNLDLPQDIDIIMDAFDNFPSRFILEELAVENNIPMVHGGIEGWFGQVMNIIPGRTVLLKDVFAGSENDKKPAVISPAVSIIANYQVVEAVKIVLEKSDILIDKLMLINVLTGEIEKIDIKR